MLTIVEVTFRIFLLILKIGHN